MDCIFCSIVNGEIPSTKVYEDEDVFAFRDINPQTPVHIILIPKKHVMSCMDDIVPENAAVVGKLMLAAKNIAAQFGLKNGYRLINNCGHDAGQTVQHLHFHLLAGCEMGDRLL